jgi:hypothetical protein
MRTYAMTTSSTLALVIAVLVAIISAAANIFATIMGRRNTTETIEAQIAINQQVLDHQRALDRDKDARALRDARAERLRGRYGDVIEAAYALESIILIPASRSTGLTEAREKEFAEEFAVAATKFNTASVALELEVDAQAILSATRRLMKHFRDYREMRKDILVDPQAYNVEELRSQRQKFQSELEDLVVALREHIGQLDHALPEALAAGSLPVEMPYPGRLALLKRVIRGR